MSNILVTPIEEGSEAGKNSRGDGHHIRPVSIKMLEIAEKLDTLNKECQILNVENKVLHDAEGGGPDLNNFLNVRGSFVSVRGEKRRSSFLTPSLAGASKGSSSRKNFKNLTSNQQFEALHQIANQQSDIVLSFEGLKEAIKISQMSSSLKKSIGLENDNNEQLFDGDESISKMRDPEEIQFIKDILEEQAELNEKIMEVEKSRLEATLNLLSSKMEVAKEFRVTKEIYGEMISNENENESSDHDMEIDENSDGNNVAGGDEENELMRKIESKKRNLKREQDRLNQMRFLIQKLMFSCPNNAMTFDEETNRTHYNMSIRLGKDISELCEDT